MDSNGTDSYAAWTLTPDYYGPNQEFDVIWMGAAQNAIAMGEGHDAGWPTMTVLLTNLQKSLPATRMAISPRLTTKRCRTVVLQIPLCDVLRLQVQRRRIIRRGWSGNGEVVAVPD